eukprot:tig00021720_g23191.t1
MAGDWSKPVSGPRGQYEKLSAFGKALWSLHAFWVKYQVITGTIPGFLSPLERVLTHLFILGVIVIALFGVFSLGSTVVRSVMSVA